MKKTDLMILSQLRQNARTKLTDMSRNIRIPVSTIFDRIRLHEGNLIKKHTALVDFGMLGYNARAIITLSADKKDRRQLRELLEKNHNINSLYHLNNGWDFMLEVIFPGIREVEDFVEGIGEQVRLKNKKIFYILEELKREAFLCSPGAIQ